LEQWRIQQWIKRIPCYIKEIIKLNGGNEYREGLLDKTRPIEPLEHHVPQYDWEDISDINEGKEDNNELQPKLKKL
jgi:hypothetical protein